MTAAVRHSTWQVLRFAARAGGPVRGRCLRLTPSRATRSGAFLTRLVDAGLLAVATPHADPFEATYTLTALGRHAAEYGECEMTPGRPL